MTAGTRYPVHDLAAFFLGEWLLSREIFDVDGVGLGTFDGSARFDLDEDVLFYHESGVLRMGQHAGQASRDLRYHLVAPGRAAVYFDYGDFFHELDLRTGHWQARHPCRDDLYRGEFDVFGADSWRQRWDVSGPTKNHVLVTDFRRERTVVEGGR